jgi:hypothetical protein
LTGIARVVFLRGQSYPEHMVESKNSPPFRKLRGLGLGGYIQLTLTVILVASLAFSSAPQPTQKTHHGGGTVKRVR